MKIRRFNESSEDKCVIRVKDIISFLQKFDPDTKVYLDKDGWQGFDEVDCSKDNVIRYLIDDSAITHRGQDYLIINN